MIKSILITGAHGSIGSEICGFFDKKKTIIYKLVRENKNNEKKTYTLKTIKNLKKRIDLVIHLAGYNPHPYLKLNSEKDLYNKNIEIHRNILGIIRRNNVEKVIFFSTFSLYQNGKIVNENSKLSINDYYTKSKIWMEKQLSKQDLSCYILRSSAIIFKNSKNNWISQIISKISKNEEITLYNKDNKYNNCLHISDLKKVILKLISIKKKQKKIYNISSNKPLKILEIKNIIKKNKAYNKKVLIKHNSKISGFFNSSKKIQKELNIKFKSTKDTLSSVLSKDLRKKIIIFGSNGYIGSYLNRELKNQYNILSINKNNINKKIFKNKNLSNTLSSCNIIYLIIKNNKNRFYKKNINFLNKILNKISSDYIDKFILISSAHSHNKDYIKFNNTREKLITKIYKNKAYIFCPGKVYGNKIIKSNYGINSFLENVKKQRIKIYGQGKNYCPHTYIEDLKKILILAINSKILNGKHYVYDNKKISFIKIAKKIKSYSNNASCKIVHVGKSLNYRIKRSQNFTTSNFRYTNLFSNINKIINEKL